MIDIALYITYILLAVAALGAIVLPLIKSLDDPGSLIKSALGVAALVVVFLIAYMISDSEVTPQYASFGITETSSKMVGASLITLYLMGLIAIGSILFSEIAKIFK